MQRFLSPAIAAFFGSSEMAGINMPEAQMSLSIIVKQTELHLTLNTPLTPAFPPLDENLVNIVNGSALQLLQ